MILVALKKRKIIIFFLSLGLFFLLLGTIYLKLKKGENFSNGNLVKKIKIEKVEIYAETIFSEEKLILGLGQRDSLCSNCGMLFEFKGEKPRSFWMKGMRFPLDIIWILDKKIVHLEKNIAYDSTETFYPKKNADAVLEVNAGFSDSYNFKEGTYLKY
jgi:uncharacterized membrane protein (UPF0127 family)